MGSTNDTTFEAPPNHYPPDRNFSNFLCHLAPALRHYMQSCVTTDRLGSARHRKSPQQSETEQEKMRTDLYLKEWRRLLFDQTLDIKSLTPTRKC